MLVLTMVASATILGACGGSTPAPETPTATATTPSTDETSAPVASDTSGGTWRTDLPVGASVGNVSRATPVLLADGSTVTLEELADGKPLLLYFYATW